MAGEGERYDMEGWEKDATTVGLFLSKCGAAARRVAGETEIRLQDIQFAVSQDVQRNCC